MLFEKNADQLVSPASLAKLMTAEVVFNEIKEGNLKLDDEFVVSENAWRKGGAPSGGSTMFAPLHSRVKVDDLCSGVIIQSGNDACIALAEGIAGNEDGFRAPDERARARARPDQVELHQFDRTARSGAWSHGARARASSRSTSSGPIRISIKFYGEREFTWNKIRQQNRNPLLAMNIGADGLKTGFTKEAGYGLVGSAVQNGLRLIVVVNGLKTAKERADEAQQAARMGFPRLRVAAPVRRRPDRRRGQGLSAASSGHVPLVGERRDPADGAAQHQREDRRAHRLYRAGAGAGREGPADRHAEGLARRQPGARGAAAGRRERVERQPARSAPSMRPTELVIGLFRAGA